MTAAQRSAFRTIRVRAWFTGKDARLALLWAQTTGDAQTVALAAALVEAARALEDHAAGLSEQGEGE